MDDILQDFLAETAERLATTDQDILLLEQDSRNRDALARIFRAVHNIKSSAGFLHLARLQALSHAMETILVSAREEQIILTPMLVTLVLAGFDRLRRIMTGWTVRARNPPVMTAIFYRPAHRPHGRKLLHCRCKKTKQAIRRSTACVWTWRCWKI